MKDVLEKVEAHIQAAEFGSARLLLSRLNLRKVPREHVVRVSSLARRCGSISTSLRLLNPIIRDRRKTSVRPSESEIADYAFSLHRSGATAEAEDLFEEIQDGQRPETLLYRSIIDFSLWKYDAAVPLLERYITLDSLSAYQRTIGRLNLASAYLQIGATEKTRETIDSIPSDSRSGSKLVLGLILEIEMQMSYLVGDFSSVRKLILSAEELIKGKEDRLRVWIMKWDLLTRMRNSQDGVSATDLGDFQDSSARLQSWEQLRDFDYHRLSYQPDMELLNKLSFGTPYTGFVRRLDSLQPSRSELPEHWIWYPDVATGRRRARSSTDILDLRTGKLTEKAHDHELSGQLLLLARTLCTDLYRPPKTGTLFSALFPDEYYNPVHSPNRVHQAAHRFNSFCKEAEFPIRISAVSGNYFLKLYENLGVKMSRDGFPASRSLMTLESYKAQIGSQSFRLLDFCAHSKQPKRSAQRSLHEGVETGAIERMGKGKKTRYRFSA